MRALIPPVTLVSCVLWEHLSPLARSAHSALPDTTARTRQPKPPALLGSIQLEAKVFVPIVLQALLARLTPSRRLCAPLVNTLLQATLHARTASPVTFVLQDRRPTNL